MSKARTIEDKLTERFTPTSLQIINESHLHAGHGHGEFDGSGETHFRVRIVSDRFEGMSRIDRHRAVNETLSEELSSGVHALAVEPSAPGEPSRAR